MHISNHPLRFATPAQLGEALQQARSTSLGLFDCFFGTHGEPLVRASSADGFNPPLWQLGHIAWFWEWFVLREAQSTDTCSALRASLLSKGDDWFDSNTPLRSRWALDLPSKGALKTYCHEVLDRSLDRLSRTPNHDAALYPFRLALAHEDLCAEQLLCSLQAHGLAAPARYSAPGAYSWAQGEIQFPGGTIALGSGEGGFVFDSEQPPFLQKVAAFKMDSTLVSNQQFAEFVADGGYQRRQLWSENGLQWLMRQERSAPRYWHRYDASWHCLRFGTPIKLDPHEPVRHLNLYEVQAYCMWAERRLPLEAEWEYAVRSEHPALCWGDLLEWTASSFTPYPGFSAGPWRSYSQPYFTSHQSLRGASFATSARLRSATLRHFALPATDYLFAGFRTCAWN